MIKCFILTENSKIKKINLTDLKKSKYLQVWIDITSPKKADFDKINKHIHIHKLTIEDCLKRDASIKLEHFENYNFVVIKGIKYKNSKIKLREIDIIQSKNIVITSHKEPNELFEKLIKDKGILTDTMKKGSDFLLHHLVDLEVDNYFPVLSNIDKKVLKIEDQLFKKSDPNLLNNLFILKRELLNIRRTTMALKDVISLLTKRNIPFISLRVEAYFRDVFDHLISINNLIEDYRGILSNALEVHFSLTSNKMNEVMQVLTIIATIMMPLTLITGIYGMNFRYMPELTWKYAYPLTLLFMLLLGVCMLIYFKKKKWI